MGGKKKLRNNESTKEDKNDSKVSVPANWKPEAFTSSSNPHGLLEESSFTTMFPKYREHYIKDCWDLVQHTLSKHNVVATLNIGEGTMMVKTTRKTWDPYIIIKARDMIRLIARSVTYESAARVLEDGIESEIIKIKNLVRNKEMYKKRRQRIIGAGGTTLQALETLTDCSVQVQGSTVSVVGPLKGIKEVRNVVLKTMDNNLPYVLIKHLMIKRDLEKDPTKKNESWEKYFPDFKPKNVQRKKPKIKAKKEYQTFPPPQPESKIDMQLASGEYFLKQTERKAKLSDQKRMKQLENVKKKKEKRMMAFVPPEER